MDLFTKYTIYTYLMEPSPIKPNKTNQTRMTKGDYIIGMLLYVLIVICACIVLPFAASYIIVEGLAFIAAGGWIKGAICLTILIAADKLLFTIPVHNMEEKVRRLIASPRKRGNNYCASRYNEHIERYAKIIDLDIEQEKQKSELAVERFYKEYNEENERRRQRSRELERERILKGKSTRY